MENEADQKDNAVQESLPFSSRSTWGGKKTYAAEEVEAYVGMLRESYGVMEAELKKTAVDKESLTVAERARVEAECKFAEAEAKIVNAEGKRLAAEEKLVEAESELAAAEERFVEVEGKLAALNGRLSEEEEKRMQAESKLAELDGALGQTRGQDMALAEAWAKITELEGEIKMAKNEADAKAANLMADINSYQAQMREKDIKIQELQEHQYQVFEVSENESSTELAPASSDYANQFVDILETVRKAANNYAYDVKTKADEYLENMTRLANEKLEKAETSAGVVVRDADDKAADILQSAKTEADGIREEAQVKAAVIEQKAKETLVSAELRAKRAVERGKQELDTITALIKSSSEKYRALLDQEPGEDDF